MLPSAGSNEVTFASPDFGFTERVSLDNVREISARLAEGNLGQPALAARSSLSVFLYHLTDRPSSVNRSLHSKDQLLNFSGFIDPLHLQVCIGGIRRRN